MNWNAVKEYAVDHIPDPPQQGEDTRKSKKTAGSAHEGKKPATGPGARITPLIKPSAKSYPQVAHAAAQVSAGGSGEQAPQFNAQGATTPNTVSISTPADSLLATVALPDLRGPGADEKKNWVLRKYPQYFKDYLGGNRLQSLNAEEEDVCFWCKDGGDLLTCDYPGCKKVYHSVCVDLGEVEASDGDALERGVAAVGGNRVADDGRCEG